LISGSGVIFPGSHRVSALFGLHVIAYNLIRRGNLLRLAAMEAA
jgi:hypothetical protein